MKCPNKLTTIMCQVPRNYYKEYQVLIPGNKKEKRQGKKGNKKTKNETKKTCMRSGSRPSPEGTRLLFAGDTVSSMMCPADGQQKNDKKARRTQPI